MVQVYVNETIDDARYPNRVHAVTGMSKKELTKLLIQVAYEPTKYAIALAEEVPEDFETAPKDMVTLQEYYELRDLEPNRSQKHRMANLLSQRFLKETGQKPRTITRPDRQGRWQLKVNGFEKGDLWILDEVAKEIFK